MWQTIINDAAIILGSGGFAATLIKWLKQEAPVIEKAAEFVVKEVEAIAKTPEGAVISAGLHLKVSDALAKFHNSELGRLAAVGLNAFDGALKDLSDDQKKALILKISTSLPMDVKVSKADIEKALDEAQKLTNEIAGSDLIQSANRFTAEQQVVQTPTIGEQTQGAV